MENLKVLMQCTMLAASSSDFILALQRMRPKTAKYFVRAYWLGILLTLGVMIFA